MSYEIWLQQIEQIALHANRWCNFAIVCGCIGFVLALGATILLIKKIRDEER